MSKRPPLTKEEADAERQRRRLVRGAKEAAGRRLQHRIDARKKLIRFATFVRPHYIVNWHHEVLADHLERWARGDLVGPDGKTKVRNLAVFMPPRMGKSELVSRLLPAWLLGREPDAAVMTASYGASLASSMNRDVQRIIDSDEYREVFPDTRLWGKGERQSAEQSRLRNADEFEIVGRRGYYRCAGVGGAITGRGYNYGIIDDPVKDRIDAMSRVKRENAKGWWSSVFRTRKEDDTARTLLCQTRWHEDDLAGYVLGLMEREPDADQWAVLVFPALCRQTGEFPHDARQTGESLWEERFSAASLRTTRATVDPYTWASVYEQDPNPAKGTVFHADSFKEFTPIRTDRGIALQPCREEDQENPGPPVLADECIWFQTVDTAMKDTQEADYYAVTTFALDPSFRLFIWDVFCERVEWPIQWKTMRRLYKDRMPPFNPRVPFKEWHAGRGIPYPKPILFQAVEDKGSGIGLIQLAKAAGHPVRILKADTNKVLRAAAAAAMYENGMVYHRSRAHWLPGFVQEMTKFPNAKHDDRVDTVSYGCILATHDQILRQAVQGRVTYNSASDVPAGVTRETVKLRGGAVVDIDFEDGD